MTIVIGVDHNHLYASISGVGGKSQHHFTTVARFRRIVAEAMAKHGVTDAENMVIMCSSSIDFPEEYTSNKRLLSLVKKLVA